MRVLPQPPPAEAAFARWLQRPRLLGGVLVLALAGVHHFASTPVQSWLRNAWFDAYQVMMPRTRASAPAVIVAVDEKSLAQLGQWPWPRTLVAQLFDRLGEYRPLAVGVDVIFAEPDRHSPEAIAENNPHVGRALARELKRLTTNDETLAAAIRRLPVVLGVAGLYERGTKPVPRSAAVFRMQGDPLPWLWHFPSGLASIEKIDAVATSRGLLSADVPQGVVRRIPLIAAVGDAPFPSLGIETLRVGVGEAGFTVRTGASGIESVGIGDVLIRPDADGQLWVRFGRHDPDRFVSAADVLAGTVARDRIAGKLALFGITGIGLLDQQATPLGERMSGMEVHAQVLENIFEGNLVRRPRWAHRTESALIVALGALLILAVPVLSPVRSSLALVAATGALLLLGTALFRYAGVLLDAAAPVVCLNILFGGLLRATLAESARRQQQLHRELEAQREAAARMAGELEAARRVQIGMLPVPSLAFEGERRFDLHASMEPAREVGGDLYDFYRVGRSQLFLMVGDVSGKGMPASIFMALSKALYKSAALRALPDLGRTMAEANVEITRENPELLFVTLVACLLDVDTGELTYCNAGHEPSQVLAADGGSVRLLEGGAFDLEGKRIGGKWDLPSELPMHSRVYRAKKEINSVAHLHNRMVVVLSMAGKELVPASNPGGLFGHGPIPVYQDPALIHTNEQGDAVAAALGSRPALILRGHGSVVVGEAIEWVFAGCIDLEESALRFYMASTLGPVRAYTEDEVNRVAQGRKKMSVIQKVWDHYVSKTKVSGLMEGL